MAVTNPYADVEHVQPYVKPYGLTIGVASVPTTTQVEGFLDQTAALVDGILIARGYSTVPATGANDILMLRDPISRRAAVMTYEAGFGANDFPDGIQEMQNQWKMFISMLRNGDLRLIDQTSARKRMGTVLAKRYIED